VTLTRGFYIQTTEVTQGQWKAVTGSNPSRFSSCGDDCPVKKVSWEDVQEFIQKLNARGQGTYRLPTEAQWEYAARAGTDTPFYFGDCLSTNQANYDGNYPLSGCSKGRYRETTIPGGSLNAPNAWGLHDMHGNVYEWCADWYGDYPSGSVTNPTGPSTGSNRVGRGGSWSIDAGGCRSANRSSGSPGGRSGNLGFRLSRQP
jgi:formylglycine-generating enzyme required for sulfatase activity